MSELKLCCFVLRLEVITSETIILLKFVRSTYVDNIKNIHKPMHFWLGAKLKHAEPVWSLEAAVRWTSLWLSPICEWDGFFFLWGGWECCFALLVLYVGMDEGWGIIVGANLPVACYAIGRSPFPDRSPTNFDRLHCRRCRPSLIFRRMVDRLAVRMSPYRGRWDPIQWFELEIEILKENI